MNKGLRPFKLANFRPISLGNVGIEDLMNKGFESSVDRRRPSAAKELSDELAVDCGRWTADRF